MPGTFDTDIVEALAPAGYYVAVRIGFAFPMAEYNALPDAWVDHYTREGLMIHDPVIRWLYQNSGTVRWSEIAAQDPQGVMRQAVEHGLVFGVAVACLDADDTGQQQRTIGSFARTDREFDSQEIAELSRLLHRLHESKAPPTNLTEAELEALSLVRNGLLMKEVAFRLGISETAVKQRLKNAKTKLNARTNTQAATAAVGFGLI